ncbi:DUF3383 domain-containing protein [Aureimonas fodinaquatilis]|uniref:DUF3383 domain-containing protein n=1 Tax=Aureimonas fodinaquatilis TaxID=2565783 RepID=A0A5B0DZ42_9HYPH|nr:DUF3383 family protein [Aureimonas fodinaquatilis]KAA0970810.1 DUF3383 domain-containing protein [Aureimonas fodinaquatilis]
MAKIPYSRVVNVTLTRTDAFPSRRGFGVPLFLTRVAKTGKVDATHRTKVYGSIDEVAADWDTTDEFYQAATFAFAQNPRPIQIKVGYYSPTPVAPAETFDAAALTAQLNLIEDADNGWYWLTIDKGLRDVPAIDGLISWTESRRKMAIIDSNDPLLQNPSNTTNVAARHKGTVERTAVFYHTDEDIYGAFALAALLGTFNFDNSQSNYTGKYKRLRGVPPVNLPSSAIQAISGFVPQLGQSGPAGHMANVQIDIGDKIFVVEGSTLTANVFIDEIHVTDWIIARTEEEVLGIYLNNNAVPFDDGGMELLASAPRIVMGLADRAGLIAIDLDPETGEYAPNYTVDVPSAFDVPASQRVARVAPNIPVTFRYRGAVHYSTINYTMNF